MQIRLLAATWVCVQLWAMPNLIYAQDEAASDSERATVRKSMNQLNFQLPPDWPIEKRNGMVAPIAVEEYLARKFASVEARLQKFEQQLSGMDLRLRVLEEQSAAHRQGLRSAEQISQ